MSIKKGTATSRGWRGHPNHQKLYLSELLTSTLTTCHIKTTPSSILVWKHPLFTIQPISKSHPTFFSCMFKNKFMLTFSQNWATSALHRRFDALPTWPLWDSTKWFRKIISVLSCPDTLLSAEVQTINHGYLLLYYCSPHPPLEQDQCLITAWPPHTAAASLQHNRWAVGTAAMAESQEETMLCASHSRCHKTCFRQLLKSTGL